MATHARVIDWCSYLERWSRGSAIADLEKVVEELESELERLWRANLWLANTMDQLVDKVLEKRVPCGKCGRLGRTRTVLKRHKKGVQK